VRRGDAPSRREDGMPGRGRSGIQCCAVAFSAGSRPGLRWQPSHRRCCGSRSSGEDWLSSAGRRKLDCQHLAASARAPPVDAMGALRPSFVANDTVLPQTWPAIDTSSSRPCRDHDARISYDFSAVSSRESRTRGRPSTRRRAMSRGPSRPLDVDVQTMRLASLRSPISHNLAGADVATAS
jgi:hypothetical protein